MLFSLIGLSIPLQMTVWVKQSFVSSDQEEDRKHQACQQGEEHRGLCDCAE